MYFLAPERKKARPNTTQVEKGYSNPVGDRGRGHEGTMFRQAWKAVIS